MLDAEKLIHLVLDCFKCLVPVRRLHCPGINVRYCIDSLIEYFSQTFIDYRVDRPEFWKILFQYPDMLSANPSSAEELDSLTREGELKTRQSERRRVPPK